MDKQKIKNLVKAWYENKAKRETDPVFKFLCLWICFNAWLDYRSDKNSDKEIINWLIIQTQESSDLISEYEHAKQTEPFCKNLEALAQMSPVYDSRGHRDPIQIKDVNDRENIIRAIYKIRCNLFHGGKEANNTRDQKLVTCAQRILEKWIGNLVASWKYEN